MALAGQQLFFLPARCFNASTKSAAEDPPEQSEWSSIPDQEQLESQIMSENHHFIPFFL